MTSLKYLLTGPNGKYLQANGEFDNPIETAMLFSSLEEITTYIEQNLLVGQYIITTTAVKS